MAKLIKPVLLERERSRSRIKISLPDRINCQSNFQRELREYPYGYDVSEWRECFLSFIREIRQYLPRPYGFFDQAIVQAKFYLNGIFKGESHPFEKTPQKKLNPLQQLTYFMILNVLLPIQWLSGILMWGAQKWPAVSKMVGGLTILAPIHTISAWMFAAFLALHLYLLTTAGRTATTSLQAMVTGWEDVEIHKRKEK
ncbi:MAG: cytochrome b/b6 domain-containing protein [Chloroflexi bacterium]|nr:cytochrome b/b6 domain-containing protein [Chloroflexota bacterium]